MTLSYLRFMAVLVVVASPIPVRAADDDPFLNKLYDSLHDSPMQRKIRDLAPVPIGVVFLPWKGMTEQDMRHHFRMMKKLGFNNLKQTLSSPEWPEHRIMEIALEEDIIPFWYGEGGWEPITPELLNHLGIPRTLSKAEIRKHPKMLAYQKEIIRRGLANDSGRPHLQLTREDPSSFVYRHTPDPYLRTADVPLYQKWLRETYKTPAGVAEAWNSYGFKSWEEVDRVVAQSAGEPDPERPPGGGVGRVRDVLRFKAESHANSIRAASLASNRANPFGVTRAGGEQSLFLPLAWRATDMELIADTQQETGSFYPSVHPIWHFGEVNYELARPLYMYVSLAADLFKGGWTGAWESSAGAQQLTGGKGSDYEQESTIPGFTIDRGTITQMLLTYLAGSFKGAGLWAWNYGGPGGEFSLLNRQLEPGDRAIRAGQIAQAAERLRDELWQTHKEPQVGVLYNWDSDAIWAALSIRSRSNFRDYPMKARVGVGRALINGNIPWEHVTVRDLDRGLAPRYKTIYLPGQISLTNRRLEILTSYVQQGGRVVLDSPGGWYAEQGVVFDTKRGSVFERLFGAELADYQYSNNVPRLLENVKLNGFITEINPTRAEVVARFQTGEPAVTEYRLGQGTAVLLAWDASFAAFHPGNEADEKWIRRYAMGTRLAPYACDGAIVYRLASPAADHYFLINDGPAHSVRLDTRQQRYQSVEDPVTGEQLKAGVPITLEPYSARWLRYVKP